MFRLSFFERSGYVHPPSLRYQRDKMYCLPWVNVVVEAVTAGEAVGDSAVFDDLVPVAVVDDVVLEVDTSPRTVVSGAEK